jgi:Trypsin-co-occurring domain 1
MQELERVFVQVVPVNDGREIGWGSNVAEQLEARLADIRNAIAAGAKAVADSLGDLPTTQGWKLAEVSAAFGVTLTAEAGVILTRATAGATFEVTVLYQRET